MAHSCIISEIKRDIGRKLRFFIHTQLHSPFEKATQLYTKNESENLTNQQHKTLKRYNTFNRLPLLHSTFALQLTGIPVGVLLYRLVWKNYRMPWRGYSRR